MSQSTGETLAIGAALFVLLSAMLDPRISAGAAVVVIAAIGFFTFTNRK